mmetsp:Transcript_2108/g.3953  ORF Transcript_2108/g.3953 Transcript_2108/m.3953 type:complete len:214 (+) Transcript_2108:768-1409(+)
MCTALGWCCGNSSPASCPSISFPAPNLPTLSQTATSVFPPCRRAATARQSWLRWLSSAPPTKPPSARPSSTSCSASRCSSMRRNRPPRGFSAPSQPSFAQYFSPISGNPTHEPSRCSLLRHVCCPPLFSVLLNTHTVLLLRNCPAVYNWCFIHFLHVSCAHSDFGPFMLLTPSYRGHIRHLDLRTHSLHSLSDNPICIIGVHHCITDRVVFCT